MNAHERAKALMIEAEKLGCDTPTESMIAEAIHDAEYEIFQDIESSLKQADMPGPAACIDRWRDQKYDETCDK